MSWKTSVNILNISEFFASFRFASRFTSLSATQASAKLSSAEGWHFTRNNNTR
jgi:hypothetical protein